MFMLGCGMNPQNCGKMCWVIFGIDGCNQAGEDLLNFCDLN